jgi:hypothetical protein
MQNREEWTRESLGQHKITVGSKRKRMNLRTLSRICTISATILIAGVTTLFAGGKEYGVFECVVRKARITFDQSSEGIAAAAAATGWTVAAIVDAGKMSDCTYRARVLLLLHPAYARQLMDINTVTAPFAVLDRVNVFEDEDGIHVSVVNPQSILRTVLLDDAKYDQMAEQHLRALRGMIADAVPGEPSTKQYGEIRAGGYIGKTMGVVAGGPFNEKIEDELTVAGGNLDEIAATIQKALQNNGKEWGTHCVAKVEMKEFQTIVLGITGSPLDTRSYEIVGAGDDDARSDFACPGLGYAGAYPFELVVVKDGSDCKVRMVAPMFRMKIFFEDAGKWAFMKHMGMPGSVSSEVTDRIKAALGLQAK